MNVNEKQQNNENDNNTKSYSDPTLAEDTLFDNEGEFILPQKPLIITILGKPGTGKTYLIKSLIYQYSKIKYFKFGICICRTKFNHGYDYIPDKYVYDNYDENFLTNYFTKLKQYKEKTGKIENNFLIIDDCLGSINFYSPFWSHLISCFRHYRVTIFLAAQSITGRSSTSSLLRECTNLSYMFKTVYQPSIHALYESYGGLMDNYQEFQDTLFAVTEQKHHCLMFANDRDGKDNSYFSYVAPENVPDFKLKY